MSLASLEYPFSRLRKFEKFEEILKVVDTKHAKNSEVLLQTAHSFGLVPSNGIWLDNAYMRGVNRYSRAQGNRGEYANSQEQDRVRALQYIERAYLNASDKNEKSLSYIINKGFTWIHNSFHIIMLKRLMMLIK